MIGCGTGDETALQSDTRDSPAVGVIESRDLATRIEPSAQHRTVVIPAEGSSCTVIQIVRVMGRGVVPIRALSLSYGTHLLLETARIEEPTPFRRVLNDILGASIEGGSSIFWCILGRRNWLIQGVLTGAMDGILTYGQSQPDGDYVGRGRTHCQLGFVHRIWFQPGRTRHDDSSTSYDVTLGDTDYDALTLLDAKVNVRPSYLLQRQFAPIVHGTVVIHGILSVGAAGAFMVDDDMNLLKKAEEDMGDEIPRPFAEGGSLPLRVRSRSTFR